MEEKRARILELVEQLNHAAAVYYQGRDEVMSNYEYDKQYDELQALKGDGDCFGGQSDAACRL